YSSIATLDVNMGSGGNVVNVRQTNPDTATTFRTGAGDDLVTVSSNAPSLIGNLAGIAGPLLVDVGPGVQNQLYVSDRAAGAGNQAVLVAINSISGFAGPSDNVTVSFLGAPQLILDGSNHPGPRQTFPAA